MTKQSRLFVVVRWALLLAFALSGVLGAAPAAAQDTGLLDDTTYFAESGSTIRWDDPWVYEAEFSDSGDDYEIVALSTDLWSLLISWLPGGLSLEDARDIVLAEFASSADDFTIIDRGSYDNVSYALDIATIDGIELGIFTLFIGGSGSGQVEATVYFAPITVFEDGLDSAKDVITIDGAPIYEGVEPAGLQDLLDDNATTTSVPVFRDDLTANEAPPDDDEFAEDDEPSVRAEGSAGSRLDDVQLRDDDEEEGDGLDPDANTENSAPPDELQELGVVDNGEYVSPQFDIEVTWDDNWMLDPSDEEPVISDPDTETDVLYLAWDD